MKTTKDFKRFLSEIILWIFIVTTINPIPAIANEGSDKVIYPLKQISKLECRFNDFQDLSSDCKEDLPILHTADYTKYATLEWGYNDFTRLYTVLWWASYKYWWDIWNGGHIWTDIATAKGTPVYNIANWKVIKVKNDVMEWNYITIEHTIKWKSIYSSYMHLSKTEVNEWQILTIWTKIWEVWSTWNSTWNHLHIQIDLGTSAIHPYYYGYNSCPYSYYQITEEWKCFDDLVKNTIDPLLFFETEWAVLDNISSINIPNISSNSNINNTDSTNKSNNEMSIFDRTVYIWYPESDIKKVQEIFKKLWVYKWDINWNYADIQENIIEYQLTNNIIAYRNAEWAGWFWPKTRIFTKTDYLEYLAGGSQSNNVQIVYDAKIETQKISKTNLMTREEIEKREVEDFLKLYNIELNFINEWWNIPLNGTETLKLNITDRKGRAFKWEMPWGMTFIVNTDKVTLFPEKLFYFTDWKRDIQITWLTSGITNLYIKIWNETIKTLSLNVYDSKVAIYPKTSRIIASNKTILWAKQTWIVAFKDENNKYMINLKYWSTFNIKASWDNKICVKKWNIKDIKKIYSTNCKDSDFKSEYNFTYEDTVWWILVFDYKATSKNFNVVVKNNYNNQSLSEKKITVSEPKWLTSTYPYKNEVVNMLEQWIATWINKWYFMEDRWLTQLDSLVWIENALFKIKSKVYDTKTIKIIDTSITDIINAKKTASKVNTITRLEFLNLSYKYLVLDKDNNWSKKYRDIDEETNNKLAQIFDEQITWKDQFWQSYFRPITTITRWEWAYLLTKTLEKNAQTYLTLR